MAVVALHVDIRLPPLTRRYTDSEATMKKRPHKRDLFEEQLLGFLERRMGQPLTEELLGQFATFLWRKKTEHDLTLMREMVQT